MRQRLRAVVRLASVLLASCTVISGAEDLSTDLAPATEDGGGDIVGPSSDATPPPDGARPDAGDGGPAAIDADAAACDEPGLVARFRFDEGSGTKTVDCTSNALEGALENGGTWAQGKSGTGLALDGGWASFGDPVKLRVGTGPFTLAAWVNQAVNSTTTAYIVGKTSNNVTRGWRIAEQSGVNFTVSRGDAAVGATGGTLPIGTWMHVAAVYRPGASLEVWVDGKKLTTQITNVPQEVLDVGDAFRVGARADGLYPFYGVVDEVRVYARALDEAEIAKLATP